MKTRRTHLSKEETVELIQEFISSDYNFLEISDGAGVSRAVLSNAFSKAIEECWIDDNTARLLYGKIVNLFYHNVQTRMRKWGKSFEKRFQNLNSSSMEDKITIETLERDKEAISNYLNNYGSYMYNEPYPLSEEELRNCYSIVTNKLVYLKKNIQN